MPIVFAQPEAMAASEGAVANYVNAARSFQQAAQQHAYGGGGGGGGPGFGGWGAGFAGMGGGGGGGGGGGEPDYQAQADARARATLEVTQGQLSIGEQMRLQRMRGTLSMLDQLGPDGDGSLTAEQVRDAKVRVQTGIDPLQQRAARAAVEQAEVKNKAAMDENARLTSMRGMDAATLAADFNRNVVMSPDGTEVYISPHDGHVHVLGNRNDRRLQREQQAQQRLAAQDQHEDDRFRAELDRTERAIRGQRTGDQSTPLTNDEKNRLDERMRAAGFHSSDLGEHRAIRQEIRDNPPLIGPNARPNAQQQTILSGFDQARQEAIAQNGGTQERYSLTSNGRSRPWLATQMQDIAEAERLFRQYGTQRAMPRAVRERAERLMNAVQNRNQLPTTPSGQQFAQPAQQNGMPGGLAVQGGLSIPGFGG